MVAETLEGKGSNKNYFIFVACTKVLTWEMMRKRNKAGPGICLLCRNNEETTYHLFLTCSYSQQVWSELERQLGLSNLWIQDSIEEYFVVWFIIRELKQLKVPPYSVL